jgi:hypothetical protein
MAYGDPKIAVDVKEAEHGKIVYTDADGKTRTYYPAHTIWMSVQTLEVLTVLNELKEEGGEPNLVTRVRGTALLEERSISVVGDAQSNTRTLSITLEASDWRPKREEHAAGLLASSVGDVGGAALGFNRADWEIGNSDDWWCSCYLPKPLIEALVTEIRSGQLNDLKVSMQLRRLYTTVHPMAPVSSRGDLFIRPDLKDNTLNNPDSPFGWTRSVVFSSNSRDLRKPETPEPAEEACSEDVAPEPPPGYEPVFKIGKRIEAGCLVHARRKFEELLKNGHASPVAEEAIRRMGWIFWIEKQARGASHAERLAIRQGQARGHWDRLHEWLRTERSLVPDGSGIAAAIDYSLNRWTPLGRFLEDGNVSCHNNHLENLMRPWAMGRKAWLFAGSELAGKRSATVMSLVQSARLCGHDPWVYLRDVLTRLPTHPARDIHALLPHRWTPP